MPSVRPTTQTIGAGVGVDSRQLGALIRDLRRAQPKAYRGIRSAMLEVGEVVASEARVIASEHSRSIPPTIAVRVRVGTVSVVAGGGDLALAGLYELGNRSQGKRDTRPTFRHPLFGNKSRWYTQPRYPFLRPAARRTAPELEAKIMKVADSVAATVAGLA